MLLILNNWSQIVEEASWSERRLMRSCSVGNYMYMTGGNTDVSGTRTSEVYRSEDGITWELLTDAPGWDARAAHGFIYYDNKFWLFGGSTAAGAFFNDVWTSLDCITWEQETDASWSARHEFGYCIHNDKLYISGGVGSSWKKDVWSFDGTTWTQECANIGVGLGIREHVMASNLGNLWIYGGDTFAPASSNAIYRSTDNGANWTNLGNAAWGVRREHQYIVNDDETELAIIGGYNAVGGTSYNDVWVTTDGTTFTEVEQENAFTARSDFSFVYHLNGVYIIGGTDDSGTVLLNDVWSAPAYFPWFEGVPTGGERPLKVRFSTV